MSVDQTKYPPAEWNALAAEYALGVLEGEDARAAEELMREEPTFEAAVWQWRERLAPLTDTLEPVTPTADVWQRIQAALPNSPPRLTRQPKTRTFEAGLAFWRGWAITATAAAAAIALYLGVTAITPPPDAGRLVAVLDRPDAAGAGWVATVDPTTNEVSVVALAPPNLAANKSHELWFISADAGRPVSLGLLQTEGRRIVSPGLALQNGIIAVSLEPKGGSPTGQPTGPVIFQGTLRPLPN